MKGTRLLVAVATLSLLASFGGGAPSRAMETGVFGEPGSSFPLKRILRASDAETGDVFGNSVSVSGNVAIVGAYWEDGGAGGTLIDPGAAYIFLRNRTGVDQWGQAMKLTASDAQSQDWFGESVSVSGNYAIVGASLESGGGGDPLSGAGAAYVFWRDQGGPSNWGEVQKLTAPDADAGDRFGRSVAIHGNTAIVGAYKEGGGPADPADEAGAAYVFQNVSGYGWLPIKILRASDLQATDQFGVSVAIFGDIAIVGAHHVPGGPGDLIPDAGAAYIFERNQDGTNNWGQVAKLVAQDPGPSDYFGSSVAISGKLAVVGAPGEDGGPGDPFLVAGAAYVFENLSGSVWAQISKLTASDAEAGSQLGTSVSISGGVTMVGVYRDDGGPGDPLPQAGAAYVFMRHLGGPNAWGQAKKLTAPDAASGDAFGRAVAISGKNAVVGALGEDGGVGDPINSPGAAYVFYVSLLEAFKAN